jgi:hypothetical protein
MFMTKDKSVYQQMGLALEVAKLAGKLYYKMDRIEQSDAYKAAWYSAANHGVPYQGESWEAEKQELGKAIKKMMGTFRRRGKS